jgi:hypothetical protein
MIICPCALPYLIFVQLCGWLARAAPMPRTRTGRQDTAVVMPHGACAAPAWPAGDMRPDRPCPAAASRSRTSGRTGGSERTPPAGRQPRAKGVSGAGLDADRQGDRCIQAPGDCGRHGSSGRGAGAPWLMLPRAPPRGCSSGCSSPRYSGHRTGSRAQVRTLPDPSEPRSSGLIIRRSWVRVPAAPPIGRQAMPRRRPGSPPERGRE